MSTQPSARRKQIGPPSVAGTAFVLGVIAAAASLGSAGIDARLDSIADVIESPQAEPTTARPLDVSTRLASEIVGDSTDVPGIVVMRLDDGVPTVVGAAGVLRRGDERPITVDTPMHLGSCGKAMTATLAMILSRPILVDGERVPGGTDAAPTPPFSLDVTIESMLPDLVPTDPDERSPWADVSVRDLLAHVSGVTDPSGEAFLRFIGRVEAPIDRGGTRGPGPLVHQRRKATALVLATERGDRRYRYSNMGYVIASAMMERAANEQLESLLEERVFEPLGITTAGFGAPDGPASAWGHRASGVGEMLAIFPGPFADNRPFMTAAGRMHMSLRDWGRFVHAHVLAARGDDTPIVTADESRTLRTVSGAPDGGATYALGWIVADAPFCEGPVLTHAGSNTMWIAEVFACPSSDVILLAASNAATPGARSAVRASIRMLAEPVPEENARPASR